MVAINLLREINREPDNWWAVLWWKKYGGEGKLWEPEEGKSWRV